MLAYICVCVLSSLSVVACDGGVGAACFSACSCACLLDAQRSTQIIEMTFKINSALIAKN